MPEHGTYRLGTSGQKLRTRTDAHWALIEGVVACPACTANILPIIIILSRWLGASPFSSGKSACANKSPGSHCGLSLDITEAIWSCCLSLCPKLYFQSYDCVTLSLGGKPPGDVPGAGGSVSLHGFNLSAQGQDGAWLTSACSFASACEYGVDSCIATRPS